MDLEQQKADIMLRMKEKARIALEGTEEIREGMKKDLFAYRNESQMLIDNNLDNGKDAEHLVRLVLKAETQRVLLLAKYSTYTLAKWNSINQEIFDLIGSMKLKFLKNENRQLVDNIQEKYQIFLKVFFRYQLTRMKIDLKKLEKEKKDVLDLMEAIHSGQINQLKKAQTDFNAELENKIKLANEANLMNKWLLNARVNEKEYLISRDQRFKKKVANQISQIINLGQKLKAKLNSQNIRQVEETMAAVNDYRRAFEEYVSLMRVQDKANLIMVKVADDVQQVSDKAQAEQKQNLEKQITTANQVMFTGILSTAFLGVLLAFLISRAIVSPIKTIVLETTTAISEGDFRHKITIDRKDEIGMLAKAIQKMKEKIERVLAETDRLIQATQSGQLNIRGNAAGFNGSWRDLINGINNLVDAFKFQEQLILSEKLASVGLLAAGVAHEINNPLEIIYNYLSYIKFNFHDKKLHQTIDNVHEEISGIANIVSNLHSFSDNKQKVEEELNINLLIRDMLNLIKHTALHKNITIDFKPCEQDILIVADKNEIKQVLLNLLKNSFEAMPSGGEIFFQTSFVRENNTNYAQIIFKDTGPGIDDENLNNIFLPFYSTNKGKKNNLGLGLFVSYGILKKYQGEIVAEKGNDSGCQFTIKLPQS